MSYTFTSPIKNLNNNESLATSCSSVRRTLDGMFEEVKTILMVGWRQDSSAEFAQHLLDCEKKVTIVEVFEGNLKNVPDGIEKVYADIRDYVVSKPYDMFLWQHGPEHVSRLDTVKFLNKYGHMFKHIVLETPNGHCPQDKADYGNPYEEHVSVWGPTDYAELGFDYITYAGPNNLAFIIAYKTNESPLHS